MAYRQPSELTALLNLLPEGWQVKQLLPGDEIWEAHIAFEHRRFKLVCEKGLIDVYRLRGRQEIRLEPYSDDVIDIVPDNIARLLMHAIRPYR